ncbi:hypothetical protein ACLB2K_008317 [Fragaria x ananassa]
MAGSLPLCVLRPCFTYIFARSAPFQTNPDKHRILDWTTSATLKRVYDFGDVWPFSSHSIVCTICALQSYYMFYYSFCLYWFSITFIRRNGFVVVKLTEPIVPDAIIIEHVLGSVVDDAPKDCRVTAWMQHGMYEPYRNEFVLAEFSYDVGKRNVRTFGVSKSVVAAGDEAIANMVKLEFGSNHLRLNST